MVGQSWKTPNEGFRFLKLWFKQWKSFVKILKRKWYVKIYIRSTGGKKNFFIFAKYFNNNDAKMKKLFLMELTLALRLFKFFYN